MSRAGGDGWRIGEFGTDEFSVQVELVEDGMMKVIWR